MKKLYFFNLRRKLKKQEIDRKSIGLEKAKEIGILYSAMDEKNNDIIKKFAGELKARGKKVSVLGYRKYNPKDVIHTTFFNKKNINWLKQPKELYVKEFMEKPFDILINAYTEECLPLEYISSLSKASMRVGKFEEKKTHCHDMMLQLKEGEGIDKLLNYSYEYLNKIK